MISDTSFIRNPNYHEITDTIETLDFDKMTAVVNSAYTAVTEIYYRVKIIYNPQNNY
ncbi:MAG TPA: hypothetical protein VFW07_25815 [Parafilimonas sp.]|nr:hypothetical protein [Parafilimonas sp.]